MKKVFLIHDAFSKPTYFWYPTLESIIPEGYTLISPELPQGNVQGAQYWTEMLESYRSMIDADTIIISHGISSLLVLRFLETTKKIRAYISIAGCAEVPDHKVYVPIAESFLTQPLNWELLRAVTKQIIHIWNNRDPFITGTLSEHFAELLPGQTFVLPGSGHFTENQEPELLTTLQEFFNTIRSEDAQHELEQEAQKIQTQKETLVKSIVPGMTTYDAAVAQSVSGYQGNVISELLAKARFEEKESKKKGITNPKNILYIIGTIVLGVISFTLIVYPLIERMQQPDLIREKKYTHPIMRLETILPVEITGKDDFTLRDDLTKLQTTVLQEKTFLGIVPTEFGEPTRIDPFFAKYNLSTPLGFPGKTEQFLYGYYRPDTTETSYPFLIIQFQGYDLLYQIMRNWEPDILGDLMLLLYPDQMLPNLLRPQPAEFADQLVANIPIRIATHPDGLTVVYGFITDNLLVITTSPDVVGPVTKRVLGQ